MHITAETTNLPQHDLTAQLYLNFLLITKYEVQRQKRSNVRTENGKCTNVANRRSRVGQLTSFQSFYTLSNSPRCFGKKHMAATGVYDKVNNAIRKKNT